MKGGLRVTRNVRLRVVVDRERASSNDSTRIISYYTRSFNQSQHQLQRTPERELPTQWVRERVNPAGHRSISPVDEKCGWQRRHRQCQNHLPHRSREREGDQKRQAQPEGGLKDSELEGVRRTDSAMLTPKRPS
jgi:hypothetical protein